MSNKQGFPPCSVCGEPSGWSTNTQGRTVWFCNNHWNALKRRLQSEGIGVLENTAPPQATRRATPRSRPAPAAKRRAASNGCLYQLLAAAVFVTIFMVTLLIAVGGIK